MASAQRAAAEEVFQHQRLLYKSMGLKDKLPGMSEEEMLQLLATDGMLVEATAAGGRRFRSGGLQGGPVGGAAGEAVTA